MILLPLNPGTYAGRKFTVRYQTNGYYEIEPSEQGFSMKYVPLEVPVEKSFEDEFLGEWLEAPVAFGAFENGKLIGFVEGSMESWNQRFRISNICVFDPARRHGGLGMALMNRIIETAEALKARMVVLETQSCNENAIAFYPEERVFPSLDSICIPIPTTIRNGMKCGSKWGKSSGSRQGERDRKMRMKKVYLAVIVIALILCAEEIFSLAEGIAARDWGGVNYGQVLFPLLIGDFSFRQFKREK